MMEGREEQSEPAGAEETREPASTGGGETAGKILAPGVRSWRAPSAAEYRNVLERRIRERLGAEAAAQARPWMDDLPLGRLGAIWARLRYVEDVSALADPDWTLDAEPIGVAKLARHAFGWPMAAGVLLELRTGRRPSHPEVLFVEIPWLKHLREARGVVKSLTESGWAVLKCGSLEVADNLSQAVDSKIVRATRLGLTERV